MYHVLLFLVIHILLFVNACQNIEANAVGLHSSLIRTRASQHTRRINDRIKKQINKFQHVPSSILAELHVHNNNTIPLHLPFGWMSDGVKNAIASGLAAAIVKTILQPFDTIKTIQQHQKIRMNPIQATAFVVRNRGIGGLWSGMGITVIGSSPSVAVYFGIYSSLKKVFVRILPPNCKLLGVGMAATCGNTLASFLRVPYEVIKQRLQAGQHQSTWEAIVYCAKHEGLLGMFNGGKLTSQILRDVPYAIVTLISYEILQSYLTRVYEIQSQKIPRNSKVQEENQQLPSHIKQLKDAVCGAIAGGIGSFATTPMDVIKTRIMTSSEYKSIFDAIFKITRDEGLLTFFAGTTPRLLHKIPANGLFFLTYEFFKTCLGVSLVK